MLRRETLLKSDPKQLEPDYDHLPDIEAIFQVEGRFCKFHNKWLIAEIKRLRNKLDEVQKFIDKHKEAV